MFLFTLWGRGGQQVAVLPTCTESSVQELGACCFAKITGQQAR